MLFPQIGTYSGWYFWLNLSFFGLSHQLMQFVRQFSVIINEHLRETSRDLHKHDVIFFILSPFYWILSQFWAENDIFGDLHECPLSFMIFWITFWHSYYSRGSKKDQNGRKFVKKPSNFWWIFGYYQHFRNPYYCVNHKKSSKKSQKIEKTHLKSCKLLKMLCSAKNQNFL